MFAKITARCSVPTSNCHSAFSRSRASLSRSASSTNAPLPHVRSAAIFQPRRWFCPPHLSIASGWSCQIRRPSLVAFAFATSHQSDSGHSSAASATSVLNNSASTMHSQSPKPHTPVNQEMKMLADQLLEELSRSTELLNSGQKNDKLSRPAQRAPSAGSQRDFAFQISRAVKAEKYNAVFRLARDMKEAQITPTLEIMNNVIRAYLASGLSHKAVKTFEEMESLGIAPNIFTLNYIVEATLMKEDIGGAVRLVEQLQEKYSLAPNAYTYTLFINAYSRRNELSKCFEQLTIMDQKKIVPLLPTFEALLHACVKARDVSRVSSILEAVENLGLPPFNMVVLQNLLKICCHDDAVSTTATLFEHIRRMDAPLTQGMLLEILDSSARKERADLAEAVWTYMEKLKYTPDLLVYQSMLYAHTSAKNLRKALIMLNNMERDGFTPTPQMLEYFAKTLLPTVDKMDEAYFELEELHNRGANISLGALNAIVRSCAAVGDVDRAYATFEAFEKFKVKPTVDTLEALLNGCRIRRSLDLAAKIWKEFADRSIAPSATAYETLMQTCLSSGFIDRAVELMNSLPDYISPTANMFGMLARHCMHAGELTKARIILESMKACGFEPPPHYETWLTSGGRLPHDAKAAARGDPVQFDGSAAATSSPSSSPSPPHSAPSAPSAQSTASTPPSATSSSSSSPSSSSSQSPSASASSPTTSPSSSSPSSASSFSSSGSDTPAPPPPPPSFDTPPQFPQSTQQQSPPQAGRKVRSKFM